MSGLLALPLAVPMGTAALCLIGWNRPHLQRPVAIAGGVAFLLAAIAVFVSVLRGGPQVLWVGGWRPPFGIVLYADLMGALLVLATAVVGLSVLVASLDTVGEGREAYGYYSLVHVLLMGVSGAFLTGDLFNLYVWFEVLLISSFVLLALGARRPQLEAAIKYVVLNLVASAIFLCALGLLYGVLGSLNMADVAQRVARGEAGPYVGPLSMMFLCAFAIKAGLFPLYAWLPASYHTPPASVSALFAGLLTKVGIYSLARVFGGVFVGMPGLTNGAILWLSTLTMVFAGLGAVTQHDLRRMLSYTVLVGVGAMGMGVGLGSAGGTAGMLLYLLHSAIVSTALFLIAGAVHRRTGSYDVRQVGGLLASDPGLGAAFLVAGLALAGLPPLSGFFGKLALLQAGIASGAWWAVGALLASSLLTLVAVARAWSAVFWRPGAAPTTELHAVPRAVLSVLAAGTALFGFAAGPIAAVCEKAGAQAFDSAAIQRIVFGGGR